MQRTRRWFAPAVLSLMVLHVAALGASNLSASTSVPSKVQAEAGRCCCSGGAGMTTCPMHHGQPASGCRLRCESSDMSGLVIGLPGVPLPTFVTTPRLVPTGVVVSDRSAFAAVVLSMPAPPPRDTRSYS
jgi:hypothetical protein